MGKGSDDTLFALKSGRVKFERLGKDRKQVSIVEIAQVIMGIISLGREPVRGFFYW